MLEERGYEKSRTGGVELYGVETILFNSHNKSWRERFGTHKERREAGGKAHENFETEGLHTFLGDFIKKL